MIKRSALLEQMLIPDELIASLTDDANSRRIDCGTARVGGCSRILQNFNPSVSNAAAFLVVLARWCDIGDGGTGDVKRLVAMYDETLRSQLPVADYICLRLAEGMVAMKEEMLDKAIEDFDIVLKLADEKTAHGVLALANYWTGRCLRKRGNYDRALMHIRTGREIQLSHGHVQCAASMRVLESLTLMEKGEPKAAMEQLHVAETVLSQTDDFVTLGNIQSTYGRIFQAEGRYRQAIEYYSLAIEHFQKRGSKDGNVARAEVDASFARIQVLRQLRRNIEVCSSQQTKDSNRPAARTVLVKELWKIYELVLADLDRAALIYERLPNGRGLARVRLYRGYLHHIVGELDLAMRAATEAYIAAESKRDIILMSSARNLQCMVEEATVEEEIEGWADHALAAQDYAREAVELASGTQDRRLLARVHIWYGLTLSNAFFNARDRAHEELQAAASYLDPSVPDYILDDFQVLKKRLLENDTLDTKLSQWARGEIREKTFRQLEEDFADLVIPIAWRQEGRKVSRVAARFSISPRKVRRVLARLGYLEKETPHGDDSAESSISFDKLISSRELSASPAHKLPRPELGPRAVPRQQLTRRGSAAGGPRRG
jgi:hypothetical protein